MMIADTGEEHPSWEKPGLPLNFTLQEPSITKDTQNRSPEIAVIQIL